MGPLDRLRMAALLGVRRINRASIERWSRSTYRRPTRPLRAPLEPVPAAAYYGMPDVPAGLFVPRVIPPTLRLGRLYELPYYVLAGAAFSLYRRSPIAPEVAWDPSVHLELESDEGWDDIVEDEAFAALRVQGSNPFLLRAGGDGRTWVADYGPSFRGIHAPVVCTFAQGAHGLRPESITIGDELHLPGGAAWRKAKLVANALDARYTVFGQHLLRTHLVVSQAYALAAGELPDGHPLAAFMRVHTYGSMHVNHYAFRLVLAETSYFLQSSFVDRPTALGLMRNCLESLRFDDLVFDHDVRARGLDRFEGHPYVADGTLASRAIADYAADVASAYRDDAAVRGDEALRRWHERLVAVFPNPTDRLSTLEGRDDLVTLMSCLVYNNVLHEVSGDFSTFVSSSDPYLKRIVSMKTLADVETAPVRLNDVFLFEQGAFSGMFNTAGNNMLATPLAGFVDDARYLACLTRFRESLSAVDAALVARNAGRRFNFRRMLPRQWELSVSF